MRSITMLISLDKSEDSLAEITEVGGCYCNAPRSSFLLGEDGPGVDVVGLMNNDNLPSPPTQ